MRSSTPHRRGRPRARRLLTGALGAALLLVATAPLLDRAAAIKETSTLESLLPQTGRRAAGGGAPAGAAARAPAVTPPTDGGARATEDPQLAGSAARAPGAWSRFVDRPLIRRVRSVGAWIGCLARFLWSIPRAIFQGDSRGMLEALGALLSRSSSQPSREPTDTSAAGRSGGARGPEGPANLSLQ
jgi:hypothetical protein